MKLSLRDKFAKPIGDFWNPDPDKDIQFSPSTKPVQPQQPSAIRPNIQQLQKIITPQLKPISVEKMSDNRVKKVFEQGGRKFYQLFDNNGKMIYDSRKSSSYSRKIRMASILFKSSNKDLWLQTREELIDMLVDNNSWSRETAERYLYENPQLIENRAVDKQSEYVDYISSIEK